MRSFGILLKNEMKLSLRDMNMPIFAVGMPLAMLAVYGLLFGHSPAFEGAPYTALRGAYRVTVPDTAAATALILQHPALFRDYEITKGGMDDVFLAVTGKKLTGGAAG